MTVPELIANVLENVLRHFYTDLQTGTVRIHEYKRDERQLIKAIATYGHECNQRGWAIPGRFHLPGLDAVAPQNPHLRSEDRISARLSRWCHPPPHRHARRRA